MARNRGSRASRATIWLDEEDKEFVLHLNKKDSLTGLDTVHTLTEKLQEPENGKYILGVEISKLHQFYENNSGHYKGAGAAVDVANILSQYTEHLATDEKRSYIYGVIDHINPEICAKEIKDKIDNHLIGVADIGVAVLELNEKDREFNLDLKYGILKTANAVNKVLIMAEQARKKDSYITEN